jgi:hypothetical protein
LVYFSPAFIFPFPAGVLSNWCYDLLRADPSAHDPLKGSMTDWIGPLTDADQEEINNFHAKKAPSTSWLSHSQLKT